MRIQVGQIISHGNGTYAKVHHVGGMDGGFVMSSPTNKMEEILNIGKTFGGPKHISAPKPKTVSAPAPTPSFFGKILNIFH